MTEKRVRRCGTSIEWLTGDPACSTPRILLVRKERRYVKQGRTCQALIRVRRGIHGPKCAILIVGTGKSHFTAGLYADHAFPLVSLCRRHPAAQRVPSSPESAWPPRHLGSEKSAIGWPHAAGWSGHQRKLNNCGNGSPMSAPTGKLPGAMLPWGDYFPCQRSTRN